MKIAIISPLSISLPPKKYGGTEAVVSMLTDGLVEIGHEVTLFAAADSVTKARLIPTWPYPISKDLDRQDPIGLFIYTNSYITGKVLERADEFDVIHSHIDEHALILSKATSTPVLTTIHRKLDRNFQRRVYSFYDDVGYISVSKHQQSCMPGINWVRNVYNGIDANLIDFKSNPRGEYLLFIGRFSPEKDPVTAIKVARETNYPIILAGKIDPADKSYFEKEVEPLLSSYHKAYFVGEADFEQKTNLYQNAAATLFPIDWDEPFGLVMPESLAAGTPVIGTARGSVPEVIEDGKSGFVCESFDQLVQAVKKIDRIDRENCRRRSELFTKEKMVEAYIKVYEVVLAGSKLLH